MGVRRGRPQLLRRAWLHRWLRFERNWNHDYRQLWFWRRWGFENLARHDEQPFRGWILPGGLENDSRYVTPRMRELRDVGLLEQVQPVLAVEELPNFRDAFLTYIGADDVGIFFSIENQIDGYLAFNYFNLRNFGAGLEKRFLNGDSCLVKTMQNSLLGMPMTRSCSR